jgi:hypothetical protein
MRLSTVIACALAASVAACAKGTANQGDGPDARVVSFPDADPSQPDAAPGGTPDAAPGTPMMRTLSQTTADTIVALNSLSCNGGDPQTHSLNRYFRVFDLPAAGINSAFQVSNVTVGIETATSLGGTQPATVLLYTLNGTPSLANLSQLTSTPVTVTDQDAMMLSVPITATAPAGSKLVVEFTTPDGTAGGNLLFIGSNTAGESSPSYIVAPDCDVTDFTVASTLGATMHMVIKVTGTYNP